MSSLGTVNGHTNGYVYGDGLPTITEYERGVLAQAIQDHACAARLIAEPPVHYFRDHFIREAVRIGRSLYHADQVFDALRIGKAMRATFTDPGSDPVQILAELALVQNRTTFATFEAHLAEITKAGNSRRLHDIFSTAAQSLENGADPISELRTTLADLDDYRREAVASDTPRFRLYSAAELDEATFETTYYINNVLAANEPCALGGAEKSLKTTIMVAMGVALCIPVPFLGLFPVAEPKRFLMFSGESSLATLQETTRRICRRVGYELSDLDGFTLSPDLPQLDDVGDVVEFEAIIAGEQPDVVAVDPMMLCLGDVDEKAANMFSMGKLLRRLNEACLNNGTTLVFAHHTSGPPQYGATPKLSWLAFSGFKQFVRQWVLLNRMEEYAPGSGLHRLKMVAGGSSGHSGLWIVEIDEGSRSNPGGRHWQVAVKTTEEAKQDSLSRAADKKALAAEQKLEEERTAALRVLAKHPDGLAPTTIRDRSGISGRRWPVVLAALLERAELVEVEVTTGNPPKSRQGYKLASSES